MTLNLHLVPQPVTTADNATAHALERFVPSPEAHEIEFFRECLRERGFDVQALVRTDDTEVQRLRNVLRQIRDAGLGPDRGSGQWTADLCRTLARTALEPA